MIDILTTRTIGELELTCNSYILTAKNSSIFSRVWFTWWQAEPTTIALNLSPIHYRCAMMWATIKKLPTQWKKLTAHEQQVILRARCRGWWWHDFCLYCCYSVVWRHVISYKLCFTQSILLRCLLRTPPRCRRSRCVICGPWRVIAGTLHEAVLERSPCVYCTHCLGRGLLPCRILVGDANDCGNDCPSRHTWSDHSARIALWRPLSKRWLGPNNYPVLCRIWHLSSQWSQSKQSAMDVSCCIDNEEAWVVQLRLRWRLQVH